MVADGLISGKIAKDVLDIEWSEQTGAPRNKIVEARGMKQVTDTGAIDAAIEAVIAANPDKVEEGEGEAEARRLVCRSGDEADGWKGEPRRRECRPQDPTQFARRGVIRTKCAKRESVPCLAQFFVRTRNSEFNPYKMRVSCTSRFFSIFKSQGGVAFQNASNSY